MAETIKGLNVVIGGETKGLQAALADVNKSSKDIQSELRQVERLLKFNPKDTELLAQKQKLLGDQVATTRDKLDRLRSVQGQINDQFKKGEISEGQYRAFQREIVATEGKLKHFESQLESTGKQGRSFASKMDDIGKSFQTMGTKLQGIGNSLSAKVTAPLTAAFGVLTAGTQEFRSDLARLSTNAQMAGANMESMNQAMRQMQGVTGELDSNVEGISNLLAAGFKGDAFKQVLDELSGAAIKFSDTLKFEGLADGLQETLATGQAVGPFAELLERSGIALDGFNAGLQQAIKSGTEQNYILQTLANTGLSDVYEQYKKNNEEIIKSREAQYELQRALADLGDTLQPFLTQVTQLVTKAANAFNSLSPAGQNMVIMFGALAAAIGPALTSLGTLMKAVMAIKLPVLATVAAVAALAAVAVEVYRNWEQVKTALSATWDLLKAKASQMTLNISIAFEKMRGKVLEIVNEIIEKLSVMEDLPLGIGEKFAGLKDSISDSVGESAERLAELQKAAEENAKTIEMSTEGTKAAFRELGWAVSNDVARVVLALTGQTSAITEQTETATNQEKKQTATVSEETQKRIQLWNEEARKRNEINRLAREEEIKQDEIAAEKIQQVLDKRTAYEDQWNQRLLQMRDQYNLSQAASEEEAFAIRMQQLQKQRDTEIEHAKSVGADVYAVKQYYDLKERELLNQKDEAYKQSFINTANAMGSFFQSVAEGEEAFKDAMKGTIISLISGLQQQVIAEQAAGVAISWAKAPATFGASLAWIGQIASKVGPALLAFEGAKAAVAALAEGGKVTAPTMALIGEGRHDEAVLPLNQQVFSELGKNIAANLPQGTTGNQMVFHFHIGALIGDERGYKKLAQKVFSYEYSHKQRILGEVPT